jgi:hypothetical protein
MLIKNPYAGPKAFARLAGSGMQRSIGMHNGRTPNEVQWIGDSVEYVDSYALENTAQEPESEADREIEEILGRAIERIAGLQSNREYARLSKPMVKNDQLD